MGHERDDTAPVRLPAAYTCVDPFDDYRWPRDNAPD